MSGMYRLPPFVQENVVPSDIMYKLPSYHNDTTIAANTAASSSASSSSVSELADLLRESVKLTSDLTQSILSYVKQQPTGPSKENKQKPPVQEKKEKESKKQKNQEAESEAATHFRGNVTFHFKLQNSKKLDGKLEISHDKTYVELLSFLRDLAVKRGADQNITINQVDNHSKFHKYVSLDTNYYYLLLEIQAALTTSDGKKSNYDGFTPVLSALGEVIGFHSSQDPSLHLTSHWLNLVDEVLTKKTPIDSVIREMSRHLGPFDLLNKTAAVSLPDVVLFALIKSTPALPNNVELFIKRIGEALSGA